jgi:hypothetical protein
MPETNGTLQSVPESFTVRLTENARRDLALIAESLGISIGDALSHALGMEAFLLEEEDAGTVVMLKDKSSTWRSLPVRKRGANAGTGRYG